MARLGVFERAILEEIAKTAAQYDNYVAAGPAPTRWQEPWNRPLPRMDAVFNMPKPAPEPEAAPAVETPPPVAVSPAPAPKPAAAPAAAPAPPPPVAAAPPPKPPPVAAAPPPKPPPEPPQATAAPPQSASPALDKLLRGAAPPVAPAPPAAAPAPPPPAAKPPALHKILSEAPSAPVAPRPHQPGRFRQHLAGGKTETYKFEPFQTEEGIRKRWGDNEFNTFSSSIDKAGFKFKDPRERLNFLNTIDAESSGKGYGRVGVGDRQLPGGGSFGPLQIYASPAQDQDVNRTFGLRGGVREMYEKHPDMYYQYGAKLYNERGLNPWQTSAKKRGVMPVEDRFLVA